ncbi:MAG TPA: ABC transporter substrate-binding protein, partial [Pirellulales bacterium]|nr:ABC transporter substrate-binding protein [Pirellulales bacterium]
DIGKNPVGTGPFQFSEWVQQQRVVFKRFDGYWGGAPNLDQLTFVVITDESARLASFLSGETLIDGGLTTTDATAVKQNNNSVLVSAPQIGPYVLILDTRDAPFSDKRVRQALSLATDRNALVQGTSSGFGSVANQYMTSLNPFYDKSLPPLEEDVQQAKTLLEQAGASNLKFPLLTFNTEPYKSFTQLLQQQWARAGITVTINQLETSQFLATAGKGTNSDTPAMATILLTQRPGQVASWLVSTAFAPAGKNRGYYSNSQFDSLEQQAATHSVADAKSYEQQAQKLALEEPSSIIPLYIIPELTGVSKKIQGVDWSQWKGWAYPLWQQFWMS